MNDTRLLRLTEVDAQAVGGKADGLARLQRMGLEVPAAFIVCNARVDQFPDGLDGYYDEIGGGAVAVRSSALGEDGAAASFAGQYETVLNVVGINALRVAINRCVESLHSQRADHYRGDQHPTTDLPAIMNVLVQRMVDPRAAGIVFTADPVSARRDLLIIDAVTGLGEALANGQATPDHYEIDTAGQRVRQQLSATRAILTDAEMSLLAGEARSAAETAGVPLDLEWAIDQAGKLYWLQARPITTLPADLNELDTPLPGADDVLTRCNIGEMMPGAVSPLTISVTGWGIEWGMQRMHIQFGVQKQIQAAWRQTASCFGHLFINLTGGAAACAGLYGSTVEQMGHSLCGRIVPELQPPKPAAPWLRAKNTMKLAYYLLSTKRVVAAYEKRLNAFNVPYLDDPLAMLQGLLAGQQFYNETMAMHLQSSAYSGFACTIVESMLSAAGKESQDNLQAYAARLLAGAEGVESALMVAQLDAVVDAIATQADAPSQFQQAGPKAALAWLQSQAAGAAREKFCEFLERHGHRGYRELCMRDPAWGDDPVPLIKSMQTTLQARFAARSSTATPKLPPIDWQSLGRGLRWMLPVAHRAIRGREDTKSKLVMVACALKRAYRHLGECMETTGLLPDADLVCFFTREELVSFISRPDSASVKQAQQRRDALAYQDRLEFPEVSVGPPRPLLEHDADDVVDGALSGRPVSHGVVEGTARVASAIDEAAALRPGEILIAPITDIGWTPYFSMIAGLVTDVGSAVSHGAVIAREYGLPCVVNTSIGTRYFRTGDRVRLDGDTGTVTLLDRPGESR